MVRKIFVTLFCSVCLIIFVSPLHGQDSKKITLPNGDMVWDLNGEWEVFIENYGNFAYYGSYPNVYKITQNGSSFTGIRLKDNPPPSSGRAGTKSVQGELDKNGFKRLEIISSAGSIIPSKGQISEDGNKISIDAPNYARQTYTRK